MKNTVLSILCGLFGLGMVVFGANKLAPFLPMPKEMSVEAMAVFAAFMTIKWLMPLVGVVEIIGGILIALPKTRALGAIVILPVVVGIVLHNLMYSPADIAVPAVFALINAWAIIDSKKQYQLMIKA